MRDFDTTGASRFEYAMPTQLQSAAMLVRYLDRAKAAAAKGDANRVASCLLAAARCADHLSELTFHKNLVVLHRQISEGEGLTAYDIRRSVDHAIEAWWERLRNNDTVWVGEGNG